MRSPPGFEFSRRLAAMCILLFLSTPSPHDHIEWNADRPAFDVRSLRTDEEWVRNYLSHTHVSYVGSDEGCGCWFSDDKSALAIGGKAIREHDEDLAHCLKVVTALQEYLDDQFERNEMMQVLATWTEQRSVKSGVIRIPLNEIDESTFFVHMNGPGKIIEIIRKGV